VNEGGGQNLTSKESPTMGVEEIKAAIKNLTVQERRKVALYILELEKEYVQTTVGPQIKEDIQGVSKILQDALERLKKFAGKP
jgi:hypothetical protein